jgi:hypothetical protein
MSVCLAYGRLKQIRESLQILVRIYNQMTSNMMLQMGQDKNFESEISGIYLSKGVRETLPVGGTGMRY